jgi:membrane-bound lytic murein transglycosylase A
MRPEDLFFLQIQGSGLLTFDDGRRLRAAFAGHNGQPYRRHRRPDAQTRPARRPEHLGRRDPQLAGGDHRGPEAHAVMALNPRYVFFRLQADDGREAVGAAGVPCRPAAPSRSTFPSIQLGGLYWIDAEAPRLAGAFPAYRRAGGGAGHRRGDQGCGAG